MNQLGAIKAASMVSGLGMLLGVLALPLSTGFAGATTDGADCDRPGAILIGERLLNPKVRPTEGKVTIDLPQPIVAGTYSVTLVSFDDHSSRRPRQTEEQWFARLLDADASVVYESPSTRDLPDDQNFLTDTFDRQTVTGTAVQLQAVHRGAGTSVNSINALCALFTREELGRIVVEKVTEPAGADRRFAFNADYGAFELGDGERHDSGPIAAGTHSVSEERIGGWNTAAVCSDGSTPDAVDLQEGEVVTCTFTNRFTNSVSELDLVVTLDDAPRGQAPTEPVVTTGDSFDYVVNVMNLGSVGATNVQATLTLSREVIADTSALDPACESAPHEIVCSLGAVPVGAIIKIRVAVRVDEDSPGIGTFVSSVIAGDGDEPDNHDEEPTTFPARSGIG